MEPGRVRIIVRAYATPIPGKKLLGDTFNMHASDSSVLLRASNTVLVLMKIL